MIGPEEKEPRGITQREFTMQAHDAAGSLQCTKKGTSGARGKGAVVTRSPSKGPLLEAIVAVELNVRAAAGGEQRGQRSDVYWRKKG